MKKSSTAKYILFFLILLAGGCLIYAALGGSNTVYIIGFTIFIGVGGVLLGRLSAIYYYKMRTGKSPNEKQIWLHMLTTLMLVPTALGFMILNVMHPTTPLGYFLRTLVAGLGGIGFYVIIKKARKSRRTNTD